MGGIGPAVAAELRQLNPPDFQVVEVLEQDFRPLDCVVGCKSLIVVDTLITGQHAPGTIMEFRECELAYVPGASSIYQSLCDVLESGRVVGATPDNVRVLAAEADQSGNVSPALLAAVPKLVSRVVTAAAAARVEVRSFAAEHMDL